MAFQSENNLVSCFKDKLNSVFSLLSEPIVLEEVKLGFGIADLVISDRIDDQLKVEDDFLTSVDISIYRVIEKRKKVTLDLISDQTKCNKGQLVKSLNKLIRRALIQQVDVYFILSSKYELAYSESIAIEAKLKNWKRALMQAYRYKWFADYSYVVLDHAHVKPALQNIELFKKYNIGLISISSDGFYMRHNTPRKEKPIDKRMQILLSETVLLNEIVCTES